MDGRFECDYCNDWFFDKEELREHVKKTHPYDYDTWAQELGGLAAGIAIGSLLDDEEEDTSFPGIIGAGGDILGSLFDSFSGGDFSGGGADGDW